MNSAAAPRLVLASASPARLDVLVKAGLHPEVIVAGVDEDAFSAPDPAALTLLLAQAKAEAVAATIPEPVEGSSRASTSSASVPTTPEPVPTTPEPVEGSSGATDVLIVGCDSLLELDGQPLGKPHTPQEAIRRWQQMRGRTGELHTGHHVVRLVAGQIRRASAVATTEVTFAEVSDAEIEAYVASGEPLQVAGAFTIDGLGGAFVTRVHGDPHNVVGISLPLLRRLFGEVGVPWPSLWDR